MERKGEGKERGEKLLCVSDYLVFSCLVSGVNGIGDKSRLFSEVLAACRTCYCPVSKCDEGY